MLCRVYGYFLVWEKAQGAKYTPFAGHMAHIFVIARVACRPRKFIVA